jgi:glycosyltransferase involved in cell wall biosynthesis
MLKSIELLKIVKPIWYYNLTFQKSNIFFVDYIRLDKKQRQLINFYPNYENELVSSLDASYQAFHKGFIPNNKTKLSVLDELEVSLEDQYKFLRRFFKPKWVLYVFLVRILLLHNPLKEIISYLRTKKIKMIKVYENRLEYKDYKHFKSKIISENPLISVIIPTLNRYEHLHNALKDLEKQNYKNFEVLIVDQSEPFKSDFYDQFDLKIRLIRQKEKLLWKARNNAIRESKSDYLAFFEDDVRIDSNWIMNHLKTLDFMNSDVSCGVLLKENNKVANSHNCFRLAEQFPTGNAMVRKKIFVNIGLFDRSFEKMRMGDGEFGARCIKNNIMIINNPNSYCYDIKADNGGLREIGSWDGLRPTSFLAPRPIPSILYFFRKYWGDKIAILSLIQTIPISLNPYKFKQRKIGYLISLFILLSLFPFVFIQIFRSWLISSEMLLKGSGIEFYE